MGSAGANQLSLITGGSEAVRIDSSGNVGIGTTSPGQKLSVGGVGVFNSNGAFDGNRGLWLQGSMTSSHYSWLIAGQQNVDAALEFTPSTTTGGTTFTTPVMVIKQSGNVGIGDTSPGYTLSVDGTASISDDLFLSGDDILIKPFSDSVNSFTISSSGYTQDDDTPIFSIDTTNERIGIGTSAPSTRLVIAPTTGGASALNIPYNAANENTGLYLSSSGGSSYGDVSAGASYNGTNWVARSTAASRMGMSGGRTTFYGNTGLTVGNTFTPTEHMRIDSTNTNNVIIKSLASNADANSVLESLGAYRITMGAWDTNFFLYYTDVNNVARYLEWTGTALDLAEWFKVGMGNLDTNGAQTLSKGDILCADPEGKEKVIACKKNYDQNIIGAVSTKPYTTMGMNDLDDNHQDAVQVALNGRVPMSVSTQNGVIKIGDPITSSDIPGVGMKATKAGPVVGKAMENYNGADVGKIMVFVNVSWYGGELLADGAMEGGSIDTSSSGLSISDEFLNKLFSRMEKVGVKIQNGIMKVSQLAVRMLVIEKHADQKQSSIGEGIIKAQDTSAMIESNQIMPSSKIFITFRSDYGSRWWIGYQEKGRFIINIADPAPSELKFDWWVVQTEPAEISSPAGNEISSPPATEINLPMGDEISPAEREEITASGSEPASSDASQGGPVSANEVSEFHEQTETTTTPTEEPTTPIEELITPAEESITPTTELIP
jgi:hypothetical protein